MTEVEDKVQSLIGELEDAGASGATVVADLLDSVVQSAAWDGTELTVDYVTGVLDELLSWATYAKNELLKTE